MNIVAFEPAHVDLMRVQPWQVGEVDASSLAAPYGMAWTALADGEVIACAGLVEMWRGRACAWGLLSADAGRHMTALTREIRSRLDGVAFRRIEIAVAAGFVAGARWARLLGFEVEGYARAYLPGGCDAVLFARVKDGVCSTNDDRRGGAGDRLDLCRQRGGGAVSSAGEHGCR